MMSIVFVMLMAQLWTNVKERQGININKSEHVVALSFYCVYSNNGTEAVHKSQPSECVRMYEWKLHTRKPLYIVGLT